MFIYLKVLTITCMVMVFSSAALVFADTIILPGNDSFRALSNPGTAVTFSSDLLPADFFGPGSDPFSGSVRLGGGDLLGNDTVIRRMGPATLPGAPSSNTVSIEMLRHPGMM